MKQILCILALVGCMCFAQDSFAQKSKKAKKTTTEKVRKDGVVKSIDATATKGASTAERAQKATAKLVTALSLNARQKEDVYKINMATAEKISALRATRDSDVRGFKKGVKAAFKAQDTGIQKILNGDQLAKYKKMKKDLKAARGLL